MASGAPFDGSLGLQQRVLPSYRIPFFDRLAAACEGGLEVFAGKPEPEESILWGREPERARWRVADNRRALAGPLTVYRQPGLRSWIEERKPEVLILEANPRYLSNWGAALAARGMGIAVLGWGLGAPAAVSGLAPIGRLLWSRFLARFDALIAYSTVGAGQYRAAGFPPGHISVAPNAVVDGPEEPIRRRAPVGRPVGVLFVGRLQERKRVDLLIRAIARLGEDVELRIVGEGPARERLQAQAGQPAPVTFLGAQQGRALADSFSWADLFVLPGTGGLAVQQAMAYGLPVIVAEGDGTEADLVRPENGWLVTGGSVPALEAALRQAVSDPEGLLRKGRASRQIVAQEVNLDSMVAAFLEAIERGRGKR